MKDIGQLILDGQTARHEQGRHNAVPNLGELKNVAVGTEDRPPLASAKANEVAVVDAVVPGRVVPSSQGRLPGRPNPTT